MATIRKSTAKSMTLCCPCRNVSNAPAKASREDPPGAARSLSLPLLCPLQMGSPGEVSNGVHHLDSFRGKGPRLKEEEQGAVG